MGWTVLFQRLTVTTGIIVVFGGVALGKFLINYGRNIIVYYSNSHSLKITRKSL